MHDYVDNDRAFRKTRISRRVVQCDESHLEMTGVHTETRENDSKIISDYDRKFEAFTRNLRSNLSIAIVFIINSKMKQCWFSGCNEAKRTSSFAVG
jgi:hypothetical protein